MEEEAGGAGRSGEPAVAKRAAGRSVERRPCRSESDGDGGVTGAVFWTRGGGRGWGEGGGGGGGGSVRRAMPGGGGRGRAGLDVVGVWAGEGVGPARGPTQLDGPRAHHGRRCAPAAHTRAVPLRRRPNRGAARGTQHWRRAALRSPAAQPQRVSCAACRRPGSARPAAWPRRPVTACVSTLAHAACACFCTFALVWCLLAAAPCPLRRARA